MEDLLCPLRLRSDSQLTRNLIEKKKLLSENDPSHKKLKTALVIEGGIMFGVYGGGVVTGLEDLGFTDVFDYVIGGSAGAGTGAYFLAHQARMGTSIFYDDLVGNKFINPTKFSKIIDLDYMENIFRTSKKLDVEAVRKSRSELHISVTNLRTGLAEVLSSKDESLDLPLAIKASCAVPLLYKNGVELNGKHYCDGLVGLPNAIEYAIRELQCNNILVITNRTCDCQEDTPLPPLTERLLINLFLRKDTLGFKHAFLARESHYKHDMGLLWKREIAEDVQLGLICRNKMPISRFTRNGKKLKEVAATAEQQVVHLFK